MTQTSENTDTILGYPARVVRAILHNKLVFGHPMKLRLWGIPDGGLLASVVVRPDAIRFLSTGNGRVCLWGIVSPKVQVYEIKEGK